MWSFPLQLFKGDFNPETPKPAMSLPDRIVAAARALIGQREEPGNAGWIDDTFEQRMKDVGWHKGEAWCAYTGEEVWKTGFGKDHPLYPQLDKLFSGSALQTYNNFVKSGLFQYGMTPKRGCLVIWAHGKGPQGHLGIDVEEGDPRFKTVEGNTNKNGGREGIEIAEMPRKLHLPFAPKGLNLKGCIYAPEQ